MHRAADADYRLIVVPDAAAHKSGDVWTEKIFPMQPTVVSTEKIVKATGVKAGIQEGK